MQPFSRPQIVANNGYHKLSPRDTTGCTTKVNLKFIPLTHYDLLVATLTTKEFPEKSETPN